MPVRGSSSDFNWFLGEEKRELYVCQSVLCSEVSLHLWTRGYRDKLMDVSWVQLADTVNLDIPAVRHINP